MNLKENLHHQTCSLIFNNLGNNKKVKVSTFNYNAVKESEKSFAIVLHVKNTLGTNI